MLRRSYTIKPPPGTQINWGHPLARGLVGCWLFNENGGLRAIDLAGNNHGILTNGPLWVPGRNGIALSFDGVDDEVTFPSVPTSAISNVTVSMWVNLASVSLKGAFIKIGYPGTGSNGNGYAVGVGNSDFDTTGNNLIGLFENERWINTGAPIGTGWRHITMVIDDFGTPSFYIGAVSKGTFSGGDARAPSSNTYIGGYTSGTPDNRHFNGLIGEGWIWNRFLRPEEIQWLYTDPYAMFEQPRRGKWFYVAAGGETRNLLASIVGASTTSDVAATIARALLSNIGGVSATPDVAAIVQRAMLAGIAAQSLTPDIAAATVRNLLANIISASTTPDVIALITRSLLATIVAESVTSSAVATIARSLLTNIQVVSSTPDITQTIIRNILANVSASSLTSDISAITARALAANIIGGSYTPDITVTMEGIINLIAAITGSSLTPDITATILRQLGSSISAQSITSDALVTIVRNLLASIFNTSVTPDNLICTFLGLSIRQQILDKIQTRFEGITASGSDSIRQKVMDAVDARLKTIS